MNFEKIEMFGFKSFADKQEIKFGEGITGIVGPNGCGKSNVADAIRWVLGEQSAKTLRGSSMQDVIFNGTQDRKSLSYAEVSLFFDNSNKIFNIEYNEVIITRKLYRSGESEYFINKQPARLRDIVDLLHECGIGKEGYTIIGQGKVQEIMTSKPEDRRAIFEEATGISKFKTRKNESERKLDRTLENLTRFKDIMAELENQLEPLSKQAEKTRAYRDLSASLKHHEINSYISRLDNVATEKNKINVKIKGIDDETNSRQKEYEKTQNEYEETLLDINSADERLSKLHQEHLDKEISIEKQMGEAKLYSERISFLHSQIERTENELKSNKETLKNNAEKLTDNLKKLQESKKELATLEKQKNEIANNLQSLSDTISSREGKAQENQRKIIESIENLSNINVNKGTLSAQKKALFDKKEELNNSLQILSSKNNEQLKEREKLSDLLSVSDELLNKLKADISEKENEIKAINEKTSGIQNQIYNINSNLTMLKAKENFVIGLKESYEGYQPAVKRLLITAKDNPNISKRIKGVVASIIKTEAKFDIAIETALGGSTQNIVTDNTEDAKYLIEYLKQNKAGRVTFLPVNSVKAKYENENIKYALKEKGALGLANKIVKFDTYYTSVVSNLLGNTLIVDDINNATNIANKYRFSFKIVTLEGDIFSPQGSMTGGSRRQDVPNLLAGDRQLEDIRNKISERNKEIEELKSEKVKLDQKRDMGFDKLNELNDSFQSKKEEIISLKEKLSLYSGNSTENQTSINDLSKSLAEVESKISEIEVDFNSVSSGSMKLEEDKNLASSEADKYQKEYEELKNKKEKLSAENTAIQIKISENNSFISNILIENERINNIDKDIKDSEKTLNDNLVSTNEIIEKLKLDAEKVMLSKEEQDYVNGLREKISNLENEKVLLREKLTKADENKQILSVALNELADKKHNQEILLTKIDSDLEFSGQRIYEEYQETYETALKYKEENYNYKEGEQEIVKLKRKINSLGSINPNAIDDYNSVKERYDEMQTQKDDLEKAEKDIRQAIDTLKNEMLIQFNDGFTKINENFSKIFKELFGGGRALLELDYSESDDPLDAGVNIIVEPPGKKLQKLSLYSGGEQALTAIAILFSILRLRPMPFCVLDEIEAALDEANVDRFARYLKKFSEETQFIVITHRKPTMELADALFGVTMQEKGVSKMVSVKLSDIV